MISLSDLTEQLAVAVMGADTADLVTLAAVIDYLESIGKAAAAQLSDEERVASIQSLAGGTNTLIQQIILNEVKDADLSLRQVAQAAADLQQIVGRALKAVPAPIAKPVSVAMQASVVFSPAPVSTLNESASIVEVAGNLDDRPLVIEFIDEARSHLDKAEAELLKLEDEPGNLETVNAIFRSFHTIKGTAGFLNFAQIGKLAHAAESLLDRARESKLQLAGQPFDLVLESVDAMKRLLGLLDEATQANTVMAIWPPVVGLIDRLRDFLSGGETKLIDAAAVAPPSISAMVPIPAAPAENDPPAEATMSTAAGEQSVKVATDRLDALINGVGELVIAYSMVVQDVAGLTRENPRLAGNVSHLGKIARELQELSMAMRMVPIAGVFQKMTRVVRDVSRKAGKEIELVLIGKETELDRNVVEALGDPLVHMIRNACDHGVESPDVRVKTGKPRQGRIELKASHQSGNIVIEISDDGKGLDSARILKKAIDQGIVSANQQLSEPDIFKLIFAAGLSTAEKITDISGRGVGMDVVKKNIESLRGRVEIASTPGKGSTFTIRLPLTLAVIDGLVVRVGRQRYILPLLSIEKSIRPTADQLSTVNGRGELCMVRGMCLPIYRLHKLFNVAGAEQDPTKAIAVIAHDNDRRCCFLVDELLGQEQVVIKSLGEKIGKTPSITGGAILGDGNVSLILDIVGLMDLAVERKGIAA